jgi:uncharacterized protein
MTPILVVAGLGGSGPHHWQTYLERSFPGVSRVHQDDWDSPHPAVWTGSLVAAIEASPARSWWRTAWVAPWWPTQPIARPGLPVAAALLVAPADVEREHGTPACLRSFAMPCAPLPFRSIVVASTDDPYMTLTRARAFADDWGVEFVDAGALGHINVDAGFGPWPEGERMLRKLLTTGDRACPATPPLTGAPASQGIVDRAQTAAPSHLCSPWNNNQM